MSSFAFILCWPRRAWLLLLWHSKYLWSLPQNFLWTSVGGLWSERNHGRAAINWIVGQTFCLQTQSWHVNWLCRKAGDTQRDAVKHMLRLSTIHLLGQPWCTWPWNDPDPAAQMCSGKQMFQVSFSHVCSLLLQRIPNNGFHKNWCYILCLCWISQNKQPLLGFNSQEIVQNRVPIQKYGHQYYPGFSFSGSFFFISTPFKLIINVVFLFIDWTFKDSTQINTQEYLWGLHKLRGFFLFLF